MPYVHFFCLTSPLEFCTYLQTILHCQIAGKIACKKPELCRKQVPTQKPMSFSKMKIPYFPFLPKSLFFRTLDFWVYCYKTLERSNKKPRNTLRTRHIPNDQTTSRPKVQIQKALASNRCCFFLTYKRKRTKKIRARKGKKGWFSYPLPWDLSRLWTCGDCYLQHPPYRFPEECLVLCPWPQKNGLHPETTTTTTKKAAVVVASKNAQKPASTDVARFFLLFHNWPDTGLLAPDKYV